MKNIKSNQLCNINIKEILTNPGLLTLIIFLFICITSFNSARGKNILGETDSLYTVNQLREDFVIMQNTLQEGHAGLYRYTAKEELDKMFEKTYQSLNEPMTEIDFFVKLYPLISNIHCGHTRIGLSRSTTRLINTSPITIPFSFEFIAGKTYLLQNYSEIENLAMGGEVVSINGNPIDSIIIKMLPLTSSDAHIQVYKYHYLESLNNFSRLYTSLYGQSLSFAIKYKSPLTKMEETLEVKGISMETMMNIGEERYPWLFSDSPPISKRYENDIPILEIRTFEIPAYEDSNISIEEFLKETFKELRATGDKNLIIDLRNNDGGEGEYGRILATYLFDKPFYYYKTLEFKDTSYDFFNYTNASAEDWQSIVKDSKKNSNDWYEYTAEPGLGLQQNNDLYFKGNVYILISGKCFSTTGEVTSIIHFNKRAKFVGEECGAGYYGNQSGFIPVLTLPNTNLRVSVPLIKYTMAVDNYPKDRGIFPDYPILPDIMDLVNGKDTQMEYLMKLINK